MNLDVIASVAAAVFAGWALLQSRNQQRLSSTMDMIKRVLAAHAATRTIDLEAAHAELLDCHGRKVALTKQAKVFQDFLDELDILGFAAREKMIDKRIAVAYLDTMLDGDTVSKEYLKELADACDHPAANRDLLWLLEGAHDTRRRIKRRA